MNILLWVIQILAALVFFMGGQYKVFSLEQISQLASIKAHSSGFWTFIGISEMAGALGLVIPAATRILPVLTPVAAAALAAESAFLVVSYGYYGDYSPMVYVIVLGILAAFIAYGRFVLKPI